MLRGAAREESPLPRARERGATRARAGTTYTEVRQLLREEGNDADVCG